MARFAAVLVPGLLAAMGSCGFARAAGIDGVYALPTGAPKVRATLEATPLAGRRLQLDIVMTPIGSATPVRRYATELSKQLHVIAVSADLHDFVHEHGDRPGPNGHFRVLMPFPHAGLWHIYADGVPEGSGQQVMRFDLLVGKAEAAPPAEPPPVTGLKASAGRYAARFDPATLKAGTETELTLHLLRNGKPAPDITPFLGVAAHAVFIDAADLSYVHVHALPATGHTDHATAPMPHDAQAMGAMPGMAGMGPALAAGAHVPPDLVLHVEPPKPGTYVLWVQFDGGGAVRTVRFVLSVS